MSSDPLNMHTSISSDSPFSDESELDKQLIVELQEKFDELFRPDDDDDN
jgi:hypothetical protein